MGWTLPSTGMWRARYLPSLIALFLMFYFVELCLYALINTTTTTMHACMHTCIYSTPSTPGASIHTYIIHACIHTYLVLRLLPACRYIHTFMIHAQSTQDASIPPSAPIGATNSVHTCMHIYIYSTPSTPGASMHTYNHNNMHIPFETHLYHPVRRSARRIAR